VGETDYEQAKANYAPLHTHVHLKFVVPPKIEAIFAVQFETDDVSMSHSQKPFALFLHPDICVTTADGLSRSGSIACRFERLISHYNHRVFIIQYSFRFSNE